MANEPLENEEFSPEILAAFDAYPSPSPSKGFEARFWSQLETRQHRYRGLKGFIRRLWELEIEGVVVWRLVASTLTGGISCALVLGLSAGSSHPQPIPLPPPSQEIPAASMQAFAFYRREWDADPGLPKPRPKAAPPIKRPHGGEFSWNGSNAHLA